MGAATIGPVPRPVEMTEMVGQGEAEGQVTTVAASEGAVTKSASYLLDIRRL